MNPFYRQYLQNQQNMYQQFLNMYNNNMMAQNNPNGMCFNPFIYQQFMNQNYMNMNNYNNMQQLFQLFLQWMNSFNCPNNNNFNNGYMNNSNFNVNGGNNYTNYISYRGNQPPKQTLPRNVTFKNSQTDYLKGKNMKNVIFLASTGIRVPITVSCNETIDNLLRLFVKKIGIGENTLGTDIFFIFDAAYLQINDKRKIGDLCKMDNITITVIDSGNVIGAK